jgi:hypothetical protein
MFNYRDASEVKRWVNLLTDYIAVNELTPNQDEWFVKVFEQGDGTVYVTSLCNWGEVREFIRRTVHYEYEVQTS